MKRSTPDHRSTITEVDLTTAVGRASGLQVELLGRLARDDGHDARRRRDVELDAGEEALDLDRAHDAAKAVAGAQLLAVERPWSRLTSEARTSRRFAASRCVRIRPARSQRRSVSRLIPSARAASLAV